LSRLAESCNQKEIGAKPGKYKVSGRATPFLKKQNSFFYFLKKGVTAKFLAIRRDFRPEFCTFVKESYLKAIV